MPSSSVFVGRERELAELVSGFDDAENGGGRLFLLGGEPGIGKSALAEELARHAGERGARVLSGRCWEAGGAPPYWPWVQSIRALLEELDDDARRKNTSAFAADMAQMLPELGTGVEPANPTSDPETARFRLFDATTAFLRNVAREQPLVVTLEDLHAADTPSLLLLQFLTRALGNARILVVATYRDVEVGRDHPLASTLPELAREGVTRRISLTGLASSDVERYIAESAGVSPSEGLVRVVYRETEGNPLFVGEIVRLLASEGRLTGDAAAAIRPIPQGIRDVIALRVAHISERCNHVLGIASVLGREFRLDVLGQLSERNADELLDVLDEASSARLVSETPDTLGGMRFSHALIRDTMYEEMSASRRMRLHRRAAVLLEQMRGGNPEHLAEIANHYLASAPAGEPAKAVHYCRAAAVHALRRLAFEEAARLFTMALQALQLGDVPDDDTRFALLMALGDALTRAGDHETARDHVYEAAEIARRTRDPDGLGSAALLYGGSFTWSALRGDTRFVPLLEEALAAVTASGGNRSLQVKLMSRLAAGPWRDLPDREPRLKMAAEAVELARELGDPGTLAYALEARLSTLFGPIPLDLEEVFPIVDEIQRAAIATSSGETILQVHIWYLLAYLYYGDMERVAAERQEIARLARQLRQGPQNWFLTAIDAQLAFFTGRFADCERLARQALEAGARAEPFALFAYRAQMFWIRMEQGREAEMASEFADSMERFSAYPIWHAIAPYLLLAYGTEEAARAAFRERVSMPRLINEEYLLAVGALAEASASLRETAGAAVFYEELIPHAHLTMGGIPDINLGATTRALGRLAHVLGRYDDAERHFINAVEANDRMGARPWAAWARQGFAEMLTERDGPGDRDRAGTLVAEAAAAARELGMARLERAIEASGGPRAARATPLNRERAAGTFRREGEYWTVAFENEAFRLKDAKGLRYLATLLASPGREFHALDLVAGRRGSDVAPVPDARNASPGYGDAGEILDADAKAAYKERLADLERDIDEARSWGDAERATKAETERDALIQQLAGAVGLGGRDRRAASNAERARVNVTRAIKAVLARIAENGPGLARHLEATVRTGTFCSYTPDPRTVTIWET